MSELTDELLKKINRHDPEFLSKLVDDLIELYLEYRAMGKNHETAKNLVFIELIERIQ